MSTLFYNIIDSDNPLLEDDFEYLSKQILTRRSVLSDAESIHNDVSVYFEAAKTMVQAAQYMTSLTPLISADYLKFKTYSLSASIDTDGTTGVAIVSVDGYLHKWNSGMEMYDKIHTKMHHTFTKNSNDAWFTFTNEISTETGMQFDQRAANGNHVLTYCENFPAPSVYVKRIVDIILGI